MYARRAMTHFMNSINIFIVDIVYAGETLVLTIEEEIEKFVGAS